MKSNFIFLTTVLFFAVNGIGQTVEWENFPTNFREELTNLHYTKSGYLVGEIVIPPTLVLSSDNGQSWNFFDQSFNSLVDIKDRADGNTYIALQNKFFKINKASNTLEEITFDDNYMGIRDFEFLDDNKMFLVGRKAMYLFDQQFQLLKTIPFDPGNDNAQIELNIDNSVYVLVSGRFNSGILYKSDHELSSIDSLCLLDEDLGLDRNSMFTIYNETFYFENGFSTDPCLSWTRYDFDTIPISNALYMTENGTFFFRQYDSNLPGYITSYTPDFGQTKFNLNFDKPILKEAFLYADDSSVFLLDDDCTSYSCVYSPDLGMNWDTIDLRIGNELIWRLEASSEGLVCAELCVETFGSFYSNYDGFGTWNSTNYQLSTNVSYFRNSNVLALDNGDFLGAGSFISRSSDGGKTWQRIEGTASLSQPKFRKRKDQISVYSSTRAYVSEDFGTEWQEIIRPSRFSLFPQKMDFLSPHELVVTAYEKDSSLYYNILTGDSYYFYNDGIPIDGSDIKVSYDGQSIYIVGYDLETRICTFYSSQDKGKTFESKIVPYSESIELDRHGNIFLWARGNVIFSKDGGGSWEDITPQLYMHTITDINISPDNYIYLATRGLGILKSKEPLIEFGQIKLNTYIDQNSDCIGDTTDIRFPNALYEVVGHWVYPSDIEGQIDFYLDPGTYEVKALIDHELFDPCESSYFIDVKADSISEVDVPIMKVRECTDAQLSIGTSFLRRCFDNTYYGQLCNYGSTKMSKGILTILFDPAFEDITVSFPILSKTDTSIIVETPELDFNHCANFTIGFTLSCVAEIGDNHCIELVFIDDTGCYEKQITALDCQSNVGAWDPNDITSYVDGIEGQDYIYKEQGIEYRIRFQNTGTDTAFNIRIENSIDSKLDISSFKPLTSSHEYTWRYNNERTIDFYFDNIELVDSMINEPESHGFLKYEISLKKEVLPDQIIENSANIFFDFNEAIPTNTVRTIVVVDEDGDGYNHIDDCDDSNPIVYPTANEIPNNGIDEDCDGADLISSIHEIANTSINIYPNPTSDIVNIKVDGNLNYIVKMYELKGRLVVRGENINQLNIDDLQSGVYLLEIKELNSNQKILERIVIER